MSEIKTLYAYWCELAEQSPEKRLFGDDRHWLTTLESLSLSEHIAARFRSVGIQSGDYVALRTNRSVLTILALIGLRAIGAVVVLTDPRHEPLDFLAEASEPVPVRAVVSETGDQTFAVELDGKKTEFNLFALPPTRLLPAPRKAEDPAFLIFTSGSTGKYKAVVLSEANLITNLIDSEPLGYYFKDDIALGALPLHHVFGLALLTGTAVLGYSMFLPKSTDIPSLLQTIAEERITRMNGVPSLYLAMCKLAPQYDLSSLRGGFIGGSPSTEQQFTYIESTLGIRLVPVYGMSECIGISCTNGNDPASVRQIGVGPFYPMNEGRIVAEDGTALGTGEIGEVCVRGPMRMLGYYGHPMAPEEWLHTGDLGYLDENKVLHLTGRKKDIIIRNGTNLSPRRIENALLSIPHVKAATVVGVPDEMQGEVPAAMVVTDWDEADLLLAAKACLNKNEVPVVLQTVKALPMTASGKPDKQRIREILSRLSATEPALPPQTN